MHLEKEVYYDTTHLANIGHFLLGVGAVIALSQTKEILNEIGKVSQKMELAEKGVKNLAVGVDQLKESNQKLSLQNSNIEQVLVELRQATQSLEAKLIYTSSQEIPQKIPYIKDPKQRREEIKKTIPSDLENSNLQLGQVYLPKDKMEEAYGVFSNNDIQSQSNFLRDNLKIWNNNTNK